jgi:TonB family protein
MSDNRAEYVSRLLSRKRPPRVNAKSTLEALLGGYLAAPVDERAFAKNLQEIRQRLREKHRFGLTPDDLRAIERIYAAFRDRGPNMSEVALAASANKPAIQRSYLANEDSYSFIRDLQIRNMIVPVTGEISGDRTVRAVGRYLQEHALTVTAFYLSDVEWKAIEKGRNSDRGVVGLYENVGALPLDSTSMLIRFGNGVSRLASIQKTLMGLQSGLIQTYGDLLRVPAPESLFIAPDKGINAPIVLQHVNPPYSEKARVNKTTGTVRLEITVRSDGIVEDVVVRRSLGDGLDESAIQAIQQWRFSPATRDGVRVSVRVQVEMHFKLI